MGSNYFGEPNMENNERGSGSSPSSSSSRKGSNKKNNQDKPKQPQRGLGVAQLEKIRIHGQMTSGYNPSHFNNEDPIVQTPYSSIPSSSSFSFSSSSTPYSASYGFQSNFVVGLPEYERTNIRYGDSHPTNSSARFEHANAILETHSSAQPNMTRPLLNLYDSQHIKNHRSGSLGSSNQQNSESSDNEEPDLELRLSL
ncbi:hypothetical protein RIF29_06661 [Crotalaria pallida]|uniref:Uncharacterized protein n=1 Tax=Crotalaria pallida TaxID=3830 RepID=A0AAN9PAG5_CROPI